jgi:hypothetical protein
MAGPPIPEEKLRKLVCERIERGALPILLVRAVDAGYGHDEPRCAACGETILNAQIEYEVRDTPVGKLTLHLTCYALWQLECAGRVRKVERNAPLWRDDREAET